jgi:hypothetical protein
MTKEDVSLDTAIKNNKRLKEEEEEEAKTFKVAWYCLC